MTIRDTVIKYFECVNTENIEELCTLFCDDADLSAPRNVHAKGIDEIKAFYSTVLPPYTEHVDTPTHILVEGDRAAVFIQFNGLHESGAKVNFLASDWFTFKNDKIKTLNVFFDSIQVQHALEAGS